MTSPRYTFRRIHRLGGQLEFAAVFEAKAKDSKGPLTLYSLPNALGHPRLGISISRKVGTAPRRNRIKRLLRECFRLTQHDLPGAYDLVIVVRPHEPMALADYQELLRELALKSHQRRTARQNPAGAAPAKSAAREDRDAS